MKALILAGGLGTRLRPLTNTRPKHLLPIANRPHIEHVFDLLQRYGIDEVVLLTSYLAGAFAGAVSYASVRGLGVRVTYEEEPLGTAGALKNAEAMVGDDSFLVFNGDILTDLDLDSVLSFHRARGAEATIVLTPVEDPSAYGVVPTETDGRVLGFIEKPPRDQAPTNLINAGVYVFEPSVLDRIPARQVSSAERELFPGLVAEGAPLYALGTDAYWMDIGTPQKYLQANIDALEGRLTTDAVPEPGEGGVVVAADARVETGARISCACLGAGTVVEKDAIVERSVLFPAARVEEGAAVLGSILGEGVTIQADAVLSDAVVADGESVTAGVNEGMRRQRCE